VGVNGAVGYDDLLETVAAINKPEPEVRTSDVAVRCSGATVRVGWLVCSLRCAVGGVRCYLGTTLRNCPHPQQHQPSLISQVARSIVLGDSHVHQLCRPDEHLPSPLAEGESYDLRLPIIPSRLNPASTYLY
jgi:hypothetical protein